jgi:hypothetical protein
MASSNWTAAGSALSDHATFVRVLGEGGPEKRSGNYPVPFRHGEYSNPDKFYTGADVMLEVGLLQDNPYQHLTALQGIFGAGTVALQRTDRTAIGTVTADVELLDSPRPTQNRLVYLFPLRNPDGFWYGPALTASGTAPSIVTLGDRPIGDMILTFSAPGTATHADTASGTNAVLGYSGTGTAIVDMGARTIVKAGVRQDAFLTVTKPWWLRFAAKTTQSLTATVSVHVSYSNKYA